MTGVGPGGFPREGRRIARERDRRACRVGVDRSAVQRRGLLSHRPRLSGTCGQAQGGGTYSYGVDSGRPSTSTSSVGTTSRKCDESASTGVDELERAGGRRTRGSGDAEVPLDAVTSSGSGLDPHVSVADAAAARLRGVARARSLDTRRRPHGGRRPGGVDGISASSVSPGGSTCCCSTSSWTAGSGPSAVNARAASCADDFLALVQRARRGHLKLYMGARPASARPFAMLQRRLATVPRCGTVDVVLGLRRRPTGATDTQALLPRASEQVPRRTFDYRGARRRGDGPRRRPRPQAGRRPRRRAGPHQRSRAPQRKRCAGRRRASRRRDHVIRPSTSSTSSRLNDIVEQITGIVSAGRCPDAIVRPADQVELVDMSPRPYGGAVAHRQRLRRRAGRCRARQLLRLGNLAASRARPPVGTVPRRRGPGVPPGTARDHEAVGRPATRVVVALTAHARRRPAHPTRARSRPGSRTRGSIWRGDRVRHARQASPTPRPGPPRTAPGPPRGARAAGATPRVTGSRTRRTALSDFARLRRTANQLVLGASGPFPMGRAHQGLGHDRVISQGRSIDVHVISGDAGPGVRIAGRPQVATGYQRPAHADALDRLG